MYRNAMKKKPESDQKDVDAGIVSERFPHVSGIVIQMAYYQEPHDGILMVRTVNIFPSDHACFHMQCMAKDCLNGGFDLTSAVHRLIKDRKKSVKGKLVCCGTGDSLADDHSSISYEITVRYRRRSK